MTINEQLQNIWVENLDSAGVKAKYLYESR